MVERPNWKIQIQWALIIALLITCIVVLIRCFTCSPVGAWWNSSFIERQSGNVTANGSCINLTRFQVEFQLEFGNGTSTGDTIYFNTTSQPDFDDVRFVQNNISLPYWFEVINTGANATVWVNFSYINLTGSMFYVYYGNATAVNLSDGLATFYLYDVQDLKHFWHMNENAWSGIAADVIDEIGETDLTAVGDGVDTTGAGDCMYYRCGYFAGTNDYTTGKSNKPSMPVTFEFWGNWTTVANNPRGFFETETLTALVLRQYNTRYFEWQNDNPEVLMDNLPDQWVHYVVKYFQDTQNRIQLWTNGTLTAEARGASGTDFVWDDFTIGGINQGASGDLTGYVDEFRVYTALIPNSSIPILAREDRYMENMSAFYNVINYSACDRAFTFGSWGAVEGLTLGCPVDLILTDVGGSDVWLNWTAGLYNINFMVRSDIDRYPTDITDGRLVYYGTNNWTIDHGLSLQSGTYYYRVWAENTGIWSNCYAENKIGGSMIQFGVIAFIAIGLSILAFWQKRVWIFFLAGMAWFGFGASGIIGSASGDVLYYFGWLGVVAGLVHFMAWIGYRKKEPYVTPIDPDIEYGNELETTRKRIRAKQRGYE